MKTKSPAVRRLIAGLSLISAISALAQPQRVFPPPQVGQVRPPLWINGGVIASPSSINNISNAPYTPQQVQMAYGFNSLYSNSITGTGQTIAIVDAYDDTANIHKDLNSFNSEFGFPASTVQVIYASGTQPPTDSGWQLEESLDVEWAHAIAPGAKIMLVEAADDSYTSLIQAIKVAANSEATVISMSWGGGEFPGESSEDSIFTRKGISYVASAGDGAAGVIWPSVASNVVAVGGTTLILNALGGYGSETAWSDSGGGISAYEPQPIWQSGWFQTSWSPENRGVPDVAYLADPNYGVYVVDGGFWYEVGGTSVGAPQWSALIALADQGRTFGLSNVDNGIYTLAKGLGTTAYGGYAINPTNFNDVKSGSDGPAPDESAYPGYDLVTGVGSPVADNLVPALNAWDAAPLPPDFEIAVSPSSQTVSNGGSTSYTVTITPLRGYDGTVDFSVSGLPTGATGSFVPTSLVGSGSTTLDVSTSSNTPAGTSTLTITGKDMTGSPTHSTTTSLVVTNNSPPGALTVSAINYVTFGTGNVNLRVTASIINSSGNPVGNVLVQVTVYLNGTAYATGSGTTGASGLITYVLDDAPAGTYSTVVTKVKLTGDTWNGTYPVNSFIDAY